MTLSRHHLATLTLMAALAGACEDDDPASPNRADAGDAATSKTDGAQADTSGVDAATNETSTDSEAGSGDGSADGGAAGDTAAAPTTASGIAILSSDRKSTALSLLAADGLTLAKDACIHSGSVSPKLSAALSGDVVFPTAVPVGKEIVLIDRKNGTVSWVDATTCEVLRQVNVGAGFSPNPYDVVGGLPGGKSYVTRYGLNAGNPAEGSDIAIVDTASAKVTGRIDLRGTVSTVTPPAKPLLPMPTRAALVAGKVYVALNHLDEAYSAAGIGRVLAINPATDMLADAIDLPGLKNCGALTVTESAPGKPALVVGCNGPFSDGPTQIDSAGLALIDLTVVPAAVTVVKAGAFGRPVSGFDVAAADGMQAFTVLPGEFDGAPFDAVWSFGFASGNPRKLFQADSSFSLAIAFDRSRQRLMILDAAKATPRVRTFSIPLPAGLDAPAPSASFVSNPSSGLPPRNVLFY